MYGAKLNIHERLRLCVYSSKSLFDKGSLNLLQQSLCGINPECVQACSIVDDDEDFSNARQVDFQAADALFQDVSRTAEKGRPFLKVRHDNTMKTLRSLGMPTRPFDSEDFFGRTLIATPNLELELTIDFHSKPKLLASNCISISVEVASLAGAHSQDVLKSLLLQLVTLPIIEWGFVQSRGEFEKSNVDAKGDVVGVDLMQHLPGIYWLNYFGSQMRDSIPLAKLDDRPPMSARRHGFGVYVQLSVDPSDWQKPRYRENRDFAIEQIGSDRFFSVHHRERATVMPIKVK